MAGAFVGGGEVDLDFAFVYPDSQTTLHLGANASLSQILAAPVCGGEEKNNCGAFADDEMLSPAFTLGGRGWGFAVKRDRAGFGFVSGDDGWTAAANIARQMPSGALWTATAGAVYEGGGGLLGGEGRGAYRINGALTRFAVVSGELPISDSAGVFASATAAATTAGDGGVFSDWSVIAADAFALGARIKNIAAPGDKLAVVIGQPLRVNNAAVNITAPTGQDKNGDIIRQTERVTAAPSGREIDLQISYSRDLRRDFNIKTWAEARIQPGHNKSASPDYAVGAKVVLEF
jgi:hypothetical protein